MTVFLINIPPNTETHEYKLCYDVLKDYFKKYNIQTFTLDKNEFDVHPSWLKLKCFDYVDDDFILCWDVDLLPKKKCPSITNDLNFDKINAVVDTILHTNSTTPLFDASQFRFNCGLVGIPRKYRGLLDKVFLEAKTSTLPSYEQYPMNSELAKNEFKDVHELDKKWNCIFHLPTTLNSFLITSNVVHYTSIGSNDIRRSLIDSHHKSYFLNKN